MVSSGDSGFTGQHCMVKVQTDFQNGDKLEIETVLSNKIPVFEYYYLNLALCVPSSCSPEETLSLVGEGELRQFE